MSVALITQHSKHMCRIIVTHGLAGANKLFDIIS
jgi:hypothetical protein